jgi:SRSO17 transposase
VLVAAAGMRRPVEEDFGHGKQQTGLDQSQVRTWTAWHRHQLLSIAALGICATAAAQVRRSAAVDAGMRVTLVSRSGEPGSRCPNS